MQDVCEPGSELIGEHGKRVAGFQDRILAMYARGMTVQEIRPFVTRFPGAAVTLEMISSVTDAVPSQFTAWQSRRLEPMYPVVLFDYVRVGIRDDDVVRNKEVYLAMGVSADDTREILGIWIQNGEGTKFWMNVFNDLKARGLQHLLIALTDSLSCAAEALAVVYPAATPQTCLTHLIRNGLYDAKWSDRKAVTAAISSIYTAASCEAAERQLAAFEAGPLSRKFPTVIASLRRAWPSVVPFFALPPSVRRAVYITNSTESIAARLRKIINVRGQFTSDDDASKLIWLALRNATSDWNRTSRNNWNAAMYQIALYQDRLSRRKSV